MASAFHSKNIVTSALLLSFALLGLYVLIFFFRGTQETDATRKWKTLQDPYFELYVYSAFYDDRNISHPVVRVIGVSKSLEGALVDMLCVFSFDNFNYSVSAEAIAIGEGREVSAGRWLKEYVFVCPVEIKLDNRNRVPERVFLSSANPGEYQTPLRVELEFPQKSVFKVDFAICVATCTGYRSLFQIVEYVVLNRLFGVDKIIIYDHSFSKEVRKTLEWFVQEGIVELHQTPAFLEEEDDALHTAPAINDCLYRYMYRARRILVTGLDEFVIPRQHRNYYIMLDHLEGLQRHTKNLHKSTPFYLFRNAFFLFELPQDRTQPAMLNTLRYQQRLPPSSEENTVKSLIDPTACVAVTKNVCLRTMYGSKNDSFVFDVPEHVALNQHYTQCSTTSEDCSRNSTTDVAVEDNTILKFKSLLMDNLIYTLKKLPSS